MPLIVQVAISIPLVAYFLYLFTVMYKIITAKVPRYSYRQRKEITWLVVLKAKIIMLTMNIIWIILVGWLITLVW